MFKRYLKKPDTSVYFIFIIFYLRWGEKEFLSSDSLYKCSQQLTLGAKSSTQVSSVSGRYSSHPLLLPQCALAGICNLNWSLGFEPAVGCGCLNQ